MASSAAIVLGAGMSLSAGAQITLTQFVPNFPLGGAPIGFAYAGDKFVGSNYFSNQLYSVNLTGGNVQAFGPTYYSGGDPGNGEHFVASSFGLGGFPNRDIYVGVSSLISHINHAGTSITPFVNLPSQSGVVRGILFDAVGTFNHDMLVTTSSGNVFRVDSTGSASLLAKVGEDTEGLDVAPLGAGFGGHDGQLIVASEGSGLLRAIDSSGNVTVLNPNSPIPSAEELTFVPTNLGASGDPVEGFYGANYSINVVKGAADQFHNGLVDYRGDVIVTGETTHLVNRVHWNGTGFDITQIGQFPNQPEDGIFVTAAIITGGGNNVPEPGAVAMLIGMAVAGSGFVLRRRRVA